MQRILFKPIVLAAAASVLSGCSTFIHQMDSVTGEAILTVDAKQRAILTSTRPLKRVRTDAKGKEVETYVTKYRAFCSEPSPDVFSVLSQALSANGTLQKEPTAASAALQVAFSKNESGATIPRTQTVNLLRELMFRTCERYISGALDEEQFPIQAVRDQHVIVSILAIEQLTGAITPPVVALTGTGSAGGPPTSEAIVRLDDAWKGLQTAENGKKAAQSAYDKLESADPTCSKLQADVKAGTTPSPGSPEAKKLQDCNESQSKLTQAEKDRQSASERYELLKNALAKGGSTAVAVAGQATVGQGSSQRPDAQTISAVASAVDKIVSDTFKQDEFLLYCIRAMKDSTPDIRAACLSYVKNSVEAKSENLANEAAKFKIETQRLQTR